MDLGNLDFGALAAERDKYLKDYFYQSESYQRIANGEKTIVIGNRGTGKSAILKMLKDKAENEGTLVIELAPDDYSYEILNETFVRESEGDKILSVFNLSDSNFVFSTSQSLALDSYTDLFSDESITITNDTKMELRPWEYIILTK